MFDVQYGIIGALLVGIAFLSLFVYRYSKKVSKTSSVSLEKLKDMFDNTFDSLINTINEKKSCYEVAEVLLKEIATLSEENSLLKADIDNHKKEHDIISDGLERKTQEIRHISHQMRTSLSGLIGFTHFLESTRLTQEQEEFTSIIATSSNELLVLVNTIIDMTPTPGEISKKEEESDKKNEKICNNKIPHVLVVDDNHINKRLLEKVLENEDLEVMYASNGKEAVRLRKENNFDIIFMDIQMPVMDGVEASKAIREYEKKHAIPAVLIVALTANTGKTDRETYLNAGMTDYMPKPIMIEDIREKIAQL